MGHIFTERQWQGEEYQKKIDEYEASANSFYQKGGTGNLSEAFKLYGKARSAAVEKGMVAKIPPLSMKMGLCLRHIANEETDPAKKANALVKSSQHMQLAIQESLIRRNETSQSQGWTDNLVNEALAVAEDFFGNCLPQIEDKTARLQEAVRFSRNTCVVHLSGHPFQRVTIFIHKEVAFMAFELASELLKKKNFQGGRHHLQTMLTSIDKVKDSYALTEKDDPELTRELRTLMEDYLISCDIAEALEALEAGNLIASLAEKDLEFNDVEDALNKGWNALDKFKEAENLAQNTMDDICYQSRCAQGSLYSDIFKLPGKAKRIFTSIVDSSASHFKDSDWYQDAERRLKAMEAGDPAAQKARILEELKPELERLHKASKEAGADIQKLIDACYRISPPIPKKTGSPRPRPDVQQLGPQKAIRKMIFLYHPDKIDKSDFRQKFLSEEITKLFTERC